MKRLQDIISPISWLLVHVTGLLIIYVLFQPTVLELAVWLGVSLVAISVTSAIDLRVLPRFYPEIACLVIDRPKEEVGTLPLAERAKLVDWMIRFPARRAAYVAAVTFLKGIPEFLVVVFYWKHPDASNLRQFLMALSVSLISLCYFYGIVFVESHNYLSKKLAEIHQTYDWTDVFRNVQLPATSRQVEIHENAALLGIWIVMLMSQLLIVADPSTESRFETAFQVFTFGLVGLTLAWWLWAQSRYRFLSGLQNLFYILERFNPDHFERSLPLHTSPLLARFEMTFNSMMERLRSYRRELSHRVFVRTEESRYQALGEIAGLVVHDLGAPMQVLRFCLEQLKEKPERIQDPRYLQQLDRNGGRALELIESLRAYLKNPKGSGSFAVFREAYEHVSRLLELRFHDSPARRIRLVVDDRVLDVTVMLNKADLIHVLINLFANSYENLLTHTVSDPKVEVSVADERRGEIVIAIQDNGSGLSRRVFEQLTGLEAVTDGGVYRGLGLRLVRRLVERNGGKLEVVELPTGVAGTLFHLTLRSPSAGAEAVNL